jgi:signal transduction histidine kinase
MGRTANRIASAATEPTQEEAVSSTAPAQTPSTTVGYHEAAILSWIEDIAPYGILTTDTDLKIQSWNEWLETHSGIAAPLAIGQPLLELFPDLCKRKLDEHFRRALAGEVIVLSAAFHEYLLPFPSKLRESVSGYMQQTARVAPLSYNERLCGTITIIEDVSQREAQATALARRHERDQLLSSCLAHLLRTRDPEGMVRELFFKIADHLGVHTFLNYLVDADSGQLRLHAAAGLPERVLTELTCIPLGEGLCGTAAAQRRMVVANHLMASDNPNTLAFKSLGFGAAVCHPLMVGDRLIGTLAFATRKRDLFKPEDIEFISTVSQYISSALDRAMTESELHKAQQTLKEHAQNLESKVKERTSALEDTVAQLESFSYTVAHDLRAPIRALKGYTEMLLSDVEQPEAEKSKQYLLRMNRAADRLDALTRDLLQFSSVSRQNVQLTAIDLDELVQDLRVLRPALQEDVLIVEKPLVPVLANRTLLQQCLSNVFDNALKFVPPATKPRILLWTDKVNASEKRALPLHPALNPVGGLPSSTDPVVQPMDGLAQPGAASERVRIFIEDNGIGIAPESRQKVFGIFERLNPADKYEGTGIGLAIVARAMQRMGGTCGVESGSNAGSRFWLELLPPTQ